MNEIYVQVWNKAKENGKEKWGIQNYKKKEQVLINLNAEMCTDIIYNVCEGITDKIIAIKGKYKRVLKEYQYVDGTLYELICNAYKLVEHDKVLGVTTIHLEDKKYGSFIYDLFGNDG